MATKPTTVPTTSGTSSQVTPFSQSPAPPNTGITSGLLTAIQDKAGSQPATKAPVQAQVPPGPQVAQNVNSPPLSGGQPVQPGPAQAPPGAPPAQAAQPTQPAQNPDFILDLVSLHPSCFPLPIVACILTSSNSGTQHGSDRQDL